MRFFFRTFSLWSLFLWILFASGHAHAGGSVKLKNSEVNEVSGGWRLFVTIEVAKAPPIAHVPLKFLFTKTMAYERSLVDGKSEPVLNRMALSGQTPSLESLDVDFADGSGKIFKGTRFDFMLTRQRGYEAGEYKMQVRTTDGTDVGTTHTVMLKGDNEPVDRRSMAFNAKDPKVKKVDNGVDAGAAVRGTDDGPSANNGGDVAPVGDGDPFIPKDAYKPTEEENIRVRPKSGCGCSTYASESRSGENHPSGMAGTGLLVVMAFAFSRRRAHGARTTRRASCLPGHRVQTHSE